VIANLVVLGGVLLVAYLWSAQGLFSALLHMACTIVAGAIAFAVWEPVTYAFLLGMQQDMAWGLGLIGPFVVSLLALRIALDKLIPANLQFEQGPNLLGGAALGAVSGVITVGVLLIGVGFMRMPAKILGYSPVGYDKTGNVTRSAGVSLWLPADALTAKLYERLSTGALATSTPLAKLQPDAQLQAGELRLTFGDGKVRLSKVTIKPDEFEVIGRYDVSADNPRDLFKDSFFLSKGGDKIPQTVVLIDGSTPSPGTKLVGYVIKFGPGAREKEGQVIVGAGQLRLLSKTRDGGLVETHPVAVVSRAEGKSLRASRFRFDAPDVFIASVGGASESQMAFEFPAPAGVTPKWLLVKNVRVDVAVVPAIPIAQEAAISPEARDEAIRAGAILGGGVNLADLDSSDATEIRTVGNDFEPSREGFRVTSSLGAFQFRRQSAGGFELDEDHNIINGQKTFSKEAFDTRGAPQNLLVKEFAQDANVRIVQIDVSMDRKHSIIGRSFEMVENILPPALVDSIGQRYDAVGWIFDDGGQVDVRFTPGRPVRALAELPQLSRSKPNQKLQLIFRVTSGVELTAFTLGSRVIVSYKPPIKVGR